MPSQTFTSSGTWTAPADLLPGSVQVYAWGPSGTAGAGVASNHSGAGGGAGSLGGEPALGGVISGTVLTVTIGAAGSGSATTVTGGSVTVQGNAGGNASSLTGGAGGTAPSNTVSFAGGSGGAGVSGTSKGGGSGGGSPGTTGAGGSGGTGTTGGTAGGAAGTGPSGPPSLAGAAGGTGGSQAGAGASGSAPGSGPGGGGDNGSQSAGSATGGQVVIIWQLVSVFSAAAASAVMAGAKKAAGGVKGYLSFSGAPLQVTVVNQWSGTFAQPASFQTTPPALQSLVVALDPATSVGNGSGTPGEGNWLFMITGWNQENLAAATVGDGDDIHSFWRPGNVTTSTWAVSPSSANTRCSIWYTANLARTAADVYAAPNGAMAGMACLVVEVAGLGPWDVVTGIDVAYAAAATSLNLALAAPSASSFMLAAVCGDSNAVSQALAPGSPWQTLATVTATDGSDHVCDAVLTSAYLSTTSGSVSVSGTTSGASDLSGVIIAVQIGAPSPIPSGANAAWPGRMILEAAFGSGFQTPPDQMTWTVLSDSAASPGTIKRFWSFKDSSGVPYQLGQLQSGTGTIELDNFDGALSPSNTLSPYYPGVDTGVPVRLRSAIGTIGGITYNRWSVFQRNSLKWPEKRNKALRNFVPLSTTDIWSVVAGPCSTPYRSEVYQDLVTAGSGWWWPCDDQPVSGGVLPTQLRNAAPGNSNPLLITASPSGVSSQDLYSCGIGGSGGAAGTDLTSISSQASPNVAVYAVAANSGWMPGDPPSSPSAQAQGGAVTASPGAASWQQTQAQGDTGASGWTLIVNDTFPALSSGLTIEGWFNYGFMGGPKVIDAGDSGAVLYVVANQPYCALTLLELATSSAPVAILQLDLSGHLNLITYNGGTGTSHSIYSTSDLRCAAFLSVTVQLTSSTYAVQVNGGLTASVSGSATISAAAPAWLIVNGDLGSNGGSTAGTGLVHGGNVAVSHLAVYSGILPQYRVRAHYCAAITGFGVLPAPASVAVSSVENQSPTGMTTDGTLYQGSYGSGISPYTFSALAAAVAGSYTSGPSARAITAGQGLGGSPSDYSAAVFAGWSALAPLVKVYTAASAAAETEAAACLGSGDSFSSGFGSGASGHGVCQVSGGTGASPPAAPSSLGDTPSQRIERILGSGGMTYPGRCIDAMPSAPLVSAALDAGGQAAGSNIQNIVNSDDGWLYVDNCGNLCYRQRPHLAADSVVWYLGMDVLAGQYPFYGDIAYSSDPQRVWTDIQATQYSPDGATLPLVSPSSAAAVAAAQVKYGVRPQPYTSYLQSAAEIQSQVNWRFAQFGQTQRRIDVLTVNAAEHPAAWPFVLMANVTDIIQVYDAPMRGAPAVTETFRISNISRTISYGANGSSVTGAATVVADFLPTDYWS